MLEVRRHGTRRGAGEDRDGARRRHDPGRHRRHLRLRDGTDRSARRLRRRRGAARSRCWPGRRTCASGWCWPPRAASVRRCPTTESPRVPARGVRGVAAPAGRGSRRPLPGAPPRPAGPSRRRWPRPCTRWSTGGQGGPSGCRTTPSAQTEALQAYLSVPLATSQPAVQPAAPRPARRRHARPVHGDGMAPLAWRPLGGGRLGRPADREDDRAHAGRGRGRVDRLAEREGVTRAAVVLAWLMRHPAGVVPIIGTQQRRPHPGGGRATRSSWTGPTGTRSSSPAAVSAAVSSAAAGGRRPGRRSPGSPRCATTTTSSSGCPTPRWPRRGALP